MMNETEVTKVFDGLASFFQCYNKEKSQNVDKEIAETTSNAFTKITSILDFCVLRFELVQVLVNECMKFENYSILSHEEELRWPADVF